MIIYLLDNSNFGISGSQTWAEVAEDDLTFLAAPGAVEAMARLILSENQVRSSVEKANVAILRTSGRDRESQPQARSA